MSKANFTYKLKIFANHECIIITDKFDSESTETTVKDDIQNVLNIIHSTERVDPKNCIIVFDDPAGVHWDGYDAKEDKFELLQATSPYHAINRWLKRMREAAANGNQ